MAVLYVIGAGCSRNYEQCNSPVPDLKPPLNDDFFKMARKVIEYYKLNHMLGPIIGLDHFVRELNRLYGYGNSEYDTQVFNDDRLNLESVMTHFYLKKEILDADRDLVPVHKGSRIQTLNDLLAYTLVESLSGPICAKHVALGKEMRKGDIVWNFNYDLLMDNALYAMGKLTDSGYVIKIDYVLVNGNWEKPNDASSDVIMMKLHGSLNWVKCTNCGLWLLLRYTKSVQPFWSLIRNLDLETFRCPKCNSTKYMGLEQVIIPPSLVKNYRELQIRYLWRCAYSLEDVDQIIVIGFSFSEQDAEVEMLLRTMVQNNQIASDVPILLVNPDSKRVKKRFKTIFMNSTISNETPKSYFSNLMR